MPPIQDKALSRSSIEQLTTQLQDKLQPQYGGIKETIRAFLAQSHGVEQEETLVMEEVIRGIESELGLFPATFAGGLDHAQYEFSEESMAARKCIYLKVTVVGGKAFTSEERLQDGQMSELMLHMQFQQQRAISRRRVAASTEPSFAETFVFMLSDTLPETASEWTSLLELDAPISLCITRHKARQPHAPPCISPLHQLRRQLVAATVVDWREGLIHEAEVPVKMISVGQATVMNAVAGILHCRIEVVASPAEMEVPFSTEDVSRVMKLQLERAASRASEFYLSSRNWWQQFSVISPVHSKRPVKIYAADERGNHRCVCSFLSPQQAPLLDSPHHAARFVSLIPFERQVAVGGERVSVWHSPHSFLSKGSGDCEDHTLLLCSLLLGFGLDALVCIGRALDEDSEVGATRPHAWVATFTGKRSDMRVVFWESLTGQRYDVSPPVKAGPRTKGRKKHHFDSVSCMFNDTAFYANKQPDERITHVGVEQSLPLPNFITASSRQAGCSCNAIHSTYPTHPWQTLMDLGDDKRWKCMGPSLIKALPKEVTQVSLLPSTVDVHSAAKALEMELKLLIGDHRESLGLATRWDSNLSYVLQPALSAYETERVTGVSYGGVEFEDALKRAIPEGHSFKACPVCVSHPFPQLIFGQLLKGPTSSSIVTTTGDYTRMALRVRVTTYAEVMAVWVIIAVRYLPTDRA
ncbi:unnamed protein product [Chrysoparadoxa australica]